MSSDLLKSILLRKIPSFASIHINSISFQKTNYLLLMSLLEKSEYLIKIINFDPLFYRFYLSHKNSSNKYNISSEFNFYSSTDNFEEIFSSINKNKEYILIIGLNLLDEQKRISEFFYYLNNTKNNYDLSKIIFISYKSDNYINDAINNNCLFSLNEISHIKNKGKLYIKYDFYNHKKLSKENIVLSFELNEQKGLITSFNDILVHNLELQKIFNEVEKPIEHKTQMNLKLTEEERKAKNELILPFIKSEEEKKKALDNKKIDDIGEEEEIEEDPDDDLNI
jgi:hypothetical protein